MAFNAQVVELVDTLASGASARKGVEVRVFFWAPIIQLKAPNHGAFCFLGVYHTPKKSANSYPHFLSANKNLWQNKLDKQ